jgi:hypothetical protein
MQKNRRGDREMSTTDQPTIATWRPVLCNGVPKRDDRGTMAKRQRIKMRTTAAVLVASATALLASCGGSPRAIKVAAPQAVTPGYDSPQAAVAGYLTGSHGADKTQICSYVAPPQQGFCSFLVRTGPKQSLTPWRLGNSIVRGDKAIVVVMADKWCVGKICLTNSNPDGGLPQKLRGFEHAFDTTGNSLPALSVVRVKGRWYVALA